MALDPTILAMTANPQAAALENAQRQAQIQNLQQVNQAQPQLLQNQIQQGQLANQEAQQTNAVRPQLLQNQVTSGQLANQQSALVNAYAQHNAVGQLLSSAVDEPSYQHTKQIAAQMGIDTSQLPQNFDPNFIAQAKQNWLTTDQQLKQQEMNIQSGAYLYGNSSPNSGNIPSGSGNPQVQQSPSNSITDVFPNLNPAFAARAQAIIEGRDQLSNREAGTPIGIQLKNIINQVDPSFDFTNPTARAKAAQDYAPSGKSGQSINAINTVLGHLQTLQEQGHALNNGPIPALNAVQNYGLEQLGDARPVAFDATKKAVADELTRVWRQSGGAQSDIEEKLKSLSNSQSPAQLDAVIKDFGDLLSSKLDSLTQSYSNTMGNKVAPKGILQPDKAAFLQKLGVDVSNIPLMTGTGKGALPTSPPNNAFPDVNSLKPGTIVNGQLFLGGDPSQQSSWKQATQGGK